VPSFECTHIEVYLFRRRRPRRIEFLLLRRSRAKKLPGVWQPVTGKLDRGETAFKAARREVREETGLTPRRWWVLESMTVFFDPEADKVRALPLFAAEIGPKDPVRLSEEHDAHRFAQSGAASRLFLWQSQRRALRAVQDEVLAGGPGAKALDITRLSGARRGQRQPVR
jgi:dATP pyrophosphohydrolase